MNIGNHDEKPLVSVVVITYNQAQYISQTIQSILNQKTNFPVELIISNDNSTDNSDEIIKENLKKIPSNFHVIYQNQPKNLGMNENALWCIQQAKGKYIAFCEGDDYWIDNEKLQIQCDFMQQHPSLNLSFHGCKTIDNHGVIGKFYTNKKYIDRNIISKKKFFKKGSGSFATCSLMVKKNIFDSTLFKKIRGKMQVGDFALSLLAIHNGNIGYLKKEMSMYNQLAHQSFSLNSKKQNLLSVYYNQIKFVDFFNQETSFQHKESVSVLKKHIYLNIIFEHLKNNRLKAFSNLFLFSNNLGLENSIIALKAIAFNFLKK